MGNYMSYVAFYVSETCGGNVTLSMVGTFARNLGTLRWYIFTGQDLSFSKHSRI